jgi:hypothetical protein
LRRFPRGGKPVFDWDDLQINDICAVGGVLVRHGQGSSLFLHVMVQIIQSCVSGVYHCSALMIKTGRFAAKNARNRPGMSFCVVQYLPSAPLNTGI